MSMVNNTTYGHYFFFLKLGLRMINDYRTWTEVANSIVFIHFGSFFVCVIDLGGVMNVLDLGTMFFFLCLYTRFIDGKILQSLTLMLVSGSLVL